MGGSGDGDWSQHSRGVYGLKVMRQQPHSNMLHQHSSIAHCTKQQKETQVANTHTHTHLHTLAHLGGVGGIFVQGLTSTETAAGRHLRHCVQGPHRPVVVRGRDGKRGGGGEGAAATDGKDGKVKDDAKSMLKTIWHDAGWNET